jgi:probable rRNA maturation factor
MTAEAKPETSHQVQVQVDKRFRSQVQLGLLRQAALATLTHQRVESQYTLTVVVTGDRVLHELNLRHRGVDAPTDVLAFSAQDEVGEMFVTPPDMPRYLGDVVISFHRAEAQASDADHGLDAELQLLVVHGVLHLLGHDDEVEERRILMWAAQAQILQGLGVRVHLPPW